MLMGLKEHLVLLSGFFALALEPQRLISQGLLGLGLHGGA